MSKTKTAIQKYNAIQKIGSQVDVPFDVWRCFREGQNSIAIMGDQICLGEDYVSIETARAAVEFYVTQLGGEVTWRPS